MDARPEGSGTATSASPRSGAKTNHKRSEAEMAVPGRLPEALFDKIGDSRFWARGASRAIRAERGRKTCLEHVFRNPDGTAKPCCQRYQDRPPHFA
jgi:hypothetical protein